MKILTASLILSLTLIACQYDQDFEFLPETKAGFFLMNENGTHQLRRVSPSGTIAETWGDNLGLSNPGDIAGSGGQLWVSQARGNNLILIDLETETEEQRYDLGEFQAHYLTLGTDYLLMSDTVNLQLGFFHLKKRKLTKIKLTQKPRKAVYRSAKFFLILDKHFVAIYSEDALAPFNVLEFSRPIVDLVLDNRFRTWVYNRDSLIYRSTIGWNSHSIMGEEEQVVEGKIQHTPYLKASFGKEYIGVVSLVEGRLSNFPSPFAEDFEVDFFEARIYFIHNDSLRTMDIFSSQNRTHGPFTGKFRSAYFYVAERGE